MAGECGIPDRRYAGLAISFVVFDDEELLDRTPRDGAVRMVLAVAEGVEHHHRVRHGRIDGAQAVFSVQPLGREGNRASDSLTAQLRGPERVRLLEDAVERMEELCP